MLALWVGGIALFTFIITPAIFSSYSRDMAGEIVGRLFPGYFLYNLVLSLLALIFFFIPWSDIAQKRFRLSLFCIVIAVLNLLLLADGATLLLVGTVIKK